MTRPSQERRAPPVIAAHSPRSRRDGEERERLAEIIANPAFKRFCGLVTPGVTKVYVVARARSVGSSWVRPAAQKAIQRDTALATHLLAGDLGCPVSLEGYELDRVRGVGFSYDDDAMTSRVAIQLPGRMRGFGSAEIVARLVGRVGYGRFLVTSSGGADGGYVCHARIPLMSLRAARRGVAGLLEAIGAPRNGGIEIHPASQHGLLPFGLGGRELFHAPALEFGTEWRAFALIEHLLDLEPIDLARPRSATPRHGPSAVADAPERAAPAPEDSALATYLQLVGRGFAIVSVQPTDLPRSPTDGWEWRASRAALDSAVEAHLRISQTEQPARIGHRRINAVGLSYRADAVIDRGTIDLDGKHGHDPATIVAQLAALVGRERLLVTSSSGREGHYHCHVRFPPMPLAAARAALLALLAAVGVPERRGGTEVYPHRTNCRLPFGLGGCELFEDVELKQGARLPWQDLTVRLVALPPLDLSPWSRRAASAQPTQKPPRANGAAAVNHGVDAEARARIERWWRDGVERGERNEALFALARDCQRRSLLEGEAVQKMQHWIDDGGLRRSAEARSSRRLARQRDVVVPDLIARVYGRPLRRVEPVPLTKGEVAYLVELAKARCGEDAPKAVVLPSFKGAWIRGRDEVKLSREVWTRTLGRRGGGYAEVRQALGLFALAAPYVIDECPYTWRLVGAFPFEEDQPARQLVVPRSPGQKWKATVVLAKAERVAARWARATARAMRAAEQAGAGVTPIEENAARESMNDSMELTPSEDALWSTPTPPGARAPAAGWAVGRPASSPSPNRLRSTGSEDAAAGPIPTAGSPAPASARRSAPQGTKPGQGGRRPQGTAAALVERRRSTKA